jgi:hypothetical protein
MEQPYGPPSSGHYNLAIASLVCGIAGLVCCGLAAPVAIVLGIMSNNAEKRAGHVDNSGKTMAIIGIVLGVLGCLSLVVGLVFMILAISSMPHTGPGPHPPFRFPGMPPI